MNSGFLDKDVMEKIDDIEDNYDVDSITLGDTKIWNLVRIVLATYVTKPDYVKRFIGIQAIFEGDYPLKKDIRGGYSEEHYSMPIPLSEILESFVTSKQISR